MLDSLTLFYLEGKFVIGLLILVRVSGLFASGPFFKTSAIIPQVKIFLSLFVAVMITAAFWKEQPDISLDVMSLAMLVIKEFMVGLILGFTANIPFVAARFAGGIIDMEMGYQTGALFDREASTPTLIGEFNELIVLMLFLIINGHHYLVEGLYYSMKVLPLDSMIFTGKTFEMLGDIAMSIFILAVKFASPLLIALFLTNLGLALLARVAPQTNVFILSFQMKVMIGLIMLTVSLPAFVMISKDALANMQGEFLEMLMSLNPTRVL
ncbi:MAG: flagellar biosynthetic protein FliR [Chlorobiota bacterium]